MSVFENEKTYRASNGVDITYLEDPFGVENYKGKTKLLVIFQSLGDEKSDKDDERFPWTMVNGFKWLNCRKTYIKDNYGNIGAYYLGLHGSFSVETAIIEFLKQKITEYEILKKNIMFYGNSKGGYAALNFAFSNGLEGVNVCAAVPQYDLYDWIINYKRHLMYIMPDEVTETVKDTYKNHLRDKIRMSGVAPKVSIISSHHDNTYKEHIPALLEELDKKGIKPYVFWNDENYVTRHNNVVRNSLNEIYYVILKWLVEDTL